MNQSVHSKNSFLFHFYKTLLKSGHLFLHWKKETPVQNHELKKDMKNSLLNYDQVISLANQNMELAKKLLIAFLEELKPLPDTIRPNPTEQEMVAISQLSHKLKPSLQLLQIDSLNQLLNVYKMKYRDGTVTGKAELPGLYKEIITLNEQIVTEINKYLSVEK